MPTHTNPNRYKAVLGYYTLIDDGKGFYNRSGRGIHHSYIKATEQECNELIASRYRGHAKEHHRISLEYEWEADVIEGLVSPEVLDILQKANDRK